METSNMAAEIPLQEEPQPAKCPEHPPPPPVAQDPIPQADIETMTADDEIVLEPLENNLQRRAPLVIPPAQESHSVPSPRSPAEEDEEAEVDAELKGAESLGTDLVDAQTFVDITRQYKTGSLPDQQSRHTDCGSLSQLNPDSSGIQRCEAESPDLDTFLERRAPQTTKDGLSSELHHDSPYVRQCKTGSPGRDSRGSPNHQFHSPGQSNRAENKLDSEICLDNPNLNIQQCATASTDSNRDDALEDRYPSPDKPKKRSTGSSLDSSTTREDSPLPTTPTVQPPLAIDPTSFFIRSSSPVDSDYEMLSKFMYIPSPPLLDKDDDVYLLSTHDFDYPDDVDVAVGSR